MKNDSFIKFLRDRKDMTLIIGAKCKDGVVLIADKRVVEGTDIAITEKINLLPLGIVVAGAGIGEIIDKFNERIPYVLEDRKRLNYEAMKKDDPEIDINTVPYYFRGYEFLEDCEGLLFQLKERYKLPIQILVASGNLSLANLNYLDGESFLTSKRRTYITIGTGSPYANLLLKKLWNKDLSMKEMAKIGKFVINHISEAGVDTYVGGGVQIVFVPNRPENFDELIEDEQRKFVPHENNLSDFNDNELNEEFNKFFNVVQNKIKDN